MNESLRIWRKPHRAEVRLEALAELLHPIPRPQSPRSE